MAKKPLQILYESLRADNYDVPDNYGSFERTLTAAGTDGVRNRQTLYRSLRDNGYDVPDTYESFSHTLFAPVKLQGNGGKATAHGTTQSRFPADVEERRMRTARTPKPMDRKKAERQLAQNQRSIDVQQQRWQKEQARQQKYIEQRTKSVPDGMERVEDRAKEYLATGESSPVPIAPNPEVVRGDYQFNPDSGKMEQTWLTGDGSEYFDRGIAEFDTALKQMPEDERALLEREQELIGMGILRRGRELDEEYESQSWWEKILDAMSADYEDDMGPHQRRYQNDEEMQSLMAASRKNRDALRILEDVRGGDMNSFWHTFGTTVANGYTFTGGRAEMNDAKAIMRSSERMSEIQGKIERGEKLTNVENAALSLAQNTAWDNAIQAMYGDEYGAWAKAGGAAVGSLEMMPDFLAGMGILKGFGQAGIRLLMRNSAKGLGKYMLKGLGATLGTMAGGAVMANTIQAERTFGKAALKDAGSWWFGDDGEYVLGHYEGDRFVSGGESLAEALFHAQQEAIPEAASEGIGEFLPGVGSVLGKIGLSRIAKPLAALNGKSWYRSYQRLLKSAGWHGVAGEAFEEYFGALDGLLMGDLEGVKSLGDPRTHIDIWLSCATLGPLLNAPMIMTSAGRALYAPRAYYKAKHNVGKADRLAAFRLTDARWEPWRERIDGATNEEMADLLMEVRDSQELAPQEKKAVFDYAAALQGYRGWNLGQYIFGRDEESEGVETDAAGAASQSDPANEVGNSYHEGYNMPDEEQAGVKERLDVARAWLYNLGFDDSNIESLGGEMPEDWLAALSDEQREAVEKYRNAMAAYEGMVQHVQDDMEGAIAESEAAVDQQTHIETGAVHRAVLKTGGEVFIISGNVAITPEGNIDIENSDGDLIVFDPASGGKRMIHVSDLASADEPVMADQLKQEAAATIQETMATDAANRIDGVLPFQPGDVYSDLPFGEEQHTIQVIADGEDGVNVVVSVDGGEQQLMPMQMIQEAADAQREARIAEQAAVAATAAQPQPTEQEDAPTEEPADDEASQGDAIPEQEAIEEEQPDEDAMPMNGDEVDWFATTPERGHRYLYEEAGLSPEEADAVVANSVKDAEKELEKVSKKAPKPGNAAQLNKYRAEKAAHEQQVAAAQAAVDYWKGVQAVQQQIQMDAVRAQADERAARDAAERQAAIEAEEQYRAEQAAKKAEQAERGPFSAGAAVTEKWNAAPKVDGVRDQITLADGTAIAGHYVLVEAGAATPSHDPANGWKQSEGFPVNENGGTVNDRDYERDQAAQEITIRMSETYDSRAAQSIPVVTSDGVVLSGNGRTIAGDLAAQAGTDGAYIDYLMEFGGKYGFTAEQVGAMQHPRVLFVPDDAMPYTPETFARFNAQEMKGQNLTETAVKLGKTVDDATFNDVVGMINRYDTMADFYADESAATQAINRLLQGGVINPMQFAQMFDGDKVSGQGKEMLENLLLGKAFEGNPDAIRQLTEMPSVRQQIVSSLAEIANNSALSDYSLEDAIAQAINLVYQARMGGIKQGDTVTNYARQLSLFPSETGATVADYRNAMVLLLGDILNGKAKNTLKYILTLYNRNAAEAASGQMDLFSGAVKDPETILKETIDFINQSSKNELKQEIKQATSERKAAAESGGEAEGGEAEGGEQTEPATERSEAGRGTDAAVTEAAAQTDTNPSEGQKEAGNYKKGHVKIEGFDITIEQPKGSVRSGVDADGHEWSQEMHNTYGYIRGTEGVDGDHIDVFLSDHLDNWNGMVYVVDQVNKDGSFDEHKVMYGFDSEQEARDAYLSNYEEGWTGLGNITGVTRDEFKKWVDSSHRKTKPFAEYKSVKPVEEPTADNGGGAAAHGTGRTIQGLEDYSEEEILEDVRAFIEEQLEDAGIEGVTIKGMALHGSRMRGDARPDSDLDVVVEYEGDISEDAFFNLVNYDLNFRGPNGVIIDINPITRGKSGTLEQYMARSRRYDEEKRGDGVQESRADGEAEAVSEREAAVRDALIGVMRDAGIEVITDTDEGQRVLDAANRAAEVLTQRQGVNEDVMREHRVESNSIDSEVLFEGAKKKFGTTTDIREAGYILPDGTMLDFSGRHELNPGTDSGFLKGQRTFDHRGISQISFVYDENGDEVETGLETTMPDFIERGAIRIDYNAGNINLAVAPTAAQRRVLRTLIAGNGGDVQVDFGNGWDSDHYAEYSEAKAARVLADIDRYFGEGIKPQGDYQFFRTADGTAYGFVKDGRIYIDPRIATSETPIHEYTHMWCAALRRVNPEAWARLKEALLGHQDVVDHVKRLYPELEGDELMDEVFAHYSGRRGRERLQREQEREVAKAKGIFDKARVVAVFDRIRRALDNFWLEARHLFAGKTDGLEKLGAEDFADMAMADLMRGFNPTEEVRKLDADGRKAAQLRLVTDANAMTDTYHTGIRRIDDIKTYEEAVAEGEGIGSYPDFTEEDARAALDRGRATVYSSHPIEPGSFVSMSRMEAEEYAGGGEVYSQEVPLEDVAWIYANEGQYAPVGDGGGATAHGTRTQRTAPTFYSNAERAVEGVKQNKATAEQWKAMLTKAGGIKAGEDKWMGLSPWLDEHKGETLTKDEVLEFVRQNGVQMEEVGYSEAPDTFESLKREYDQWLHDEGFDYAQEQLRERFGDDADIAFDDLGGELVVANEEAAAAVLGSENIINSTRLDYTTEGLENKREIAFVVPEVEPYQEDDEIHFGPENQGRAVMWVRFGEARDADGKRVLVIDEIQSNRHQDARERGYRTKEAVKEDLRLQRAVDRAQDRYDAFTRQMGDKYNGPYDDIYADMTEAEREHADSLEQAVYAAEEAYQQQNYNDVPVAPFEKNWHEVAMKRMLRLAAEEGFDKVAWTTGGQQAERYDIGKRVDKIEVHDLYDGLHEVQGFKDGKAVFSQETENGEQGLAELLGKDMARKAYSNLHEGKTDYTDEKGRVNFTGDNLQIGGEGMKGFYDQMLPRFMDKYGKKWGVKTGEVTLATPGQEVMHSVDVTPEMRRSVLEQGQPLFQKAGEGDIEAVKDEVLNYFHRAAAGKEQGKGRAIGKLTQEGRAYLETVSGLKMKEDIDFILNPSDLRHIHNDHYGANEKDKGNNVPLTDDDIRKMVDVISAPERVIYGIDKKTGNKVFVFLSTNPDGTYNLAEIYTDRRGNLTAKSFYNTKKTISQRVNELLTSSPRLTSATEGASSSSDAKVPNLFEIQKEIDKNVADDDVAAVVRANSAQYNDNAENRLREAQIHSENFKRWFGDWESDPENASKVVDENGEPKVVLHGTPNGDFYIFDSEKAGSNTDQGWLGTGFYFYGNAPEYASQYAGKNGRVLQVYLDIKNPYIASVEESNRLAEANDPEMSRMFREQLEDEGYDGVYYNGDLNEEWVAFRPEQIKSATENNGDFDSSNPDMRLREALVEGGRLAIIEEGGKWRVEGMPGEFDSRHGALDEWRERAAGNVVWYMSEDGNYIEVEGNGDMYEMVSRTTTTSGRKRRERMARQQAIRSANGRRMADELAEKLGVKVRYVEDMTEQERAQFSERQLNSKGWYNPRTGEVFINLGRHTRLYDILSTFLHETVAHKGLRRLFGKDFDTFLDNVYNNVNKGIRAEIGRMAEVQKSRASEAQRARHDDEHWRRVATEEYMAKLAERLNLNHPEERTLWEKIKGFLLDKLRKIGVTVADSLSDNDLRGILWESYHSMESEGVMGYAKGVAFRDQMEREANNRGKATAHGTSTIAAEPQAQYTGSLFDMLPQAGAWARMMSNMSERELRNEIAKDGPNVTSSYSEEYDRRHIREYNQACDEIQAQLEREQPGEDRLLELLQDAEAQWADGAYKDSRRTGVLAAIDTISRALDEERADLPRVEEDNLYRDDVDEVRKEVNDYVSKYGGVEKVIINTPKDLANEYGLSTDEAQDGFEALKDRNTAAAFDPETGKIIIFVPNLLEGETEQSCFHEDFHAWLEQKYGKDVAREVCNRYLEAAKDKYPITYQSVKDSYEEKDHAEEFMAIRMEKSMASGLVEKGIYQYLNEEDRQLIDEFLETLHYDKEKEKSERTERKRKAISKQASSGGRRDTEEGSQGGGRGAGLGRRLKEQLSGLPSEDDTDDVDVAGFDAGRLTFEESITAGMLKAAADNRAAIAARTAAMRELGGNLSKLRQAMARQREYDRGTVDSIVRLARSVMESGFFRAFSPYEVKRLMSLINHAAGREDITKQAGKVVDLLLKHQLLSCENLLHEQMRTRGSKLDSQGVEVQAGLDIEGQRMVGAMRHALNLDADALQERINNTLDRMFSPDQALADVAAAEYQGLLLAQQYIEEIKGSKQEENELRQELKNAKEDLQAGTITREQYNQFVAETENAIRENRLERVAAYDRLTIALGAGLGASVQRAKEWREAQRERVNEIRHNANSDLEGVPADEHVKPSWMQRAANWSLVRFFMKPLATFDYMLRMLGSKNVNGEGYLWGRFMGGWTEATEREWRNLRAAHKALDEKVQEVFNRGRATAHGTGLQQFKVKRWSDLFTIERKLPGMDVSFWDAGEEKVHTLSQGNLLYIYMVNKMSDGRMKLRKMGINEEDVEAIRQMLDPRFIELADWLQEEFLVNKRNDYNAVYQRMFGASMAAIEHYFPLKINSRSRGQEEDLSSETYLDDNNIGSTITGSIIKRKRNSLPLDVTGADAFDVVLGHLQDMEHWAAFAEFNRDLNTLLSYKRFRNRLLNMSSVRFGSGKTLWMNFKRTCAIASGAYRPKMDRDSVDTSLVNVAKGVTAAKISFRIYTALKQLLSYPAYLSEASGLELIKSSSTPIGWVKSWNWAIDNLPGFAQRWQSRQAGDSRLRESDADWGLWRNKIVETAGRWGMSPNAFIDGLTVAMGAKAIYETKLKRYRKAGYPDEQAKRRALRDASISYNETQQSNANAYLSAMQLDRSAASVALTVFRNASMGYQRRMFQAMANLKHVLFTPGYKAQALEFMTKQMVRDGLSEQQAQQSAERVYRRATYKNLADFAIFGWVMQMAWNLGPYIPYLLMGDDDDDKKEMLEDAALHAIAGGVEGLSGGNVMSDTYNAFRSGEVSSYVNTELLPLMSDIESLKRKLGQDMVEGAHDLVNLAVQAGVGVNPQQITDVVAAVLDVADGDPKIAHEAGFVILRVLSVPQSQLDKLYIDELGLIARDARKLNAGQMAERYARYKMRRGSAYTSWAYSDEDKRKAEERYLKRFETKVKERIAELDDEQLEDNFNTDDDLRRKWVGQAVAKRAGGTDSYGSPDTDYGMVYERKRDYTDLAQDILLQVEKKKAKEAGDSDRYKALDRAQKELTTIKKGKHTKTVDEPGLGEGFDDEVMTRLRERRRELLKDLGIM